MSLLSPARLARPFVSGGDASHRAAVSIAGAIEPSRAYHPVLVADAERPATAGELRALYANSSYPRDQIEQSLAGALAAGRTASVMRNWLAQEYPASPIAPKVLTTPTPVVVATARANPPTRGNDVSLLKKIGGALGKAAVGFAAGGPMGALAGAASSLLPSRTAPTATMPTSALLPGIGTIAGRIGGAIGRAGPAAVGGALIPGVISRLAPGGTSGCGCNGSGRDSCTGQKLSSQKAPDATFFGGCCPPGRVLRRQAWGRDICMKKPRMNVFNPSALARADRRMTGFARRSTAMLRDMGFQVSRQRKVSVGKKRRRR